MERHVIKHGLYYLQADSYVILSWPPFSDLRSILYSLMHALPQKCR